MSMHSACVLVCVCVCVNSYLHAHQAHELRRDLYVRGVAESVPVA
jgi:hypothetical protein